MEFPYILVQSLIYGTIFYSLGSFEWTAAKFLWYLFFMYFTLLYFTFYGMMTTAITPNHMVAPIIAAPFYTLWNLFSGFMIPRKVCEKLAPHNSHLSSSSLFICPSLPIIVNFAHDISSKKLQGT